MAYTIISQNNSTTTLSDGVNTITVPSRVNLTSGNFTIVEVNNNMATLEDGDGNVYRDIPCVATLAGEGGGGGSALPDQTGHSGEFLTTDGTDASWSDNVKLNLTSHAKRICFGGSELHDAVKIVAIGGDVNGSNSVTVGGQIGNPYAALSDIKGTSVGISSDARGTGALAYGYAANAYGNNSIILNAAGSTQVNNDANTFKVANANGNFEIMDANGFVPTARLTKVNTTITLTAAGWSGGSQTVTVTGITATGVVLVSPDPTDQSAYTSAGILCTAQAANSLTFTATTTPSADIDVVVVML